MSQSIEVGSVLGGRYRITDHVVTSADQDLVFTGLDQVLNRRVTVLVASLENATQVASSARELATGERQDDIQVLDLGLSEGHTYLIAGGNPDPDVLLGLAYPQETYVEPFQTDTLGSEIFGSSRDTEAHEYEDDEAYYTDLDERVRADQEQHSRRPGFLNRLSDRLSERMNSSSDGSAARQAAGASALAAAGSAAKAKEEEEERKAEEAEKARLEEERRRREEADRVERERREAEELERRRARQIEEDERRERAEAERRAVERTEREERTAREAEERAEMEQREADRRRVAAARDSRDDRGPGDAEDTSTDPVPTVPAAGAAPVKDGGRDRRDPQDPAAGAAGTDETKDAPRRVRPAPRRALAAAAAAGAGAAAVVGGTAAAGAMTRSSGADGADTGRQDAAAGHDGPRDPEDDRREKKGGAGRWLVALLLCLLLVAALIFGFFLLNKNRNAVGEGESTPSATESASPSGSPSASEDASASPSEDEASAEPAALVDIYRQVPDNPPLESQHDGALPYIIDGDPETYWQGHGYTRPNFGGYTRSMNFVIQLEEPRDVTKVAIDSLAGEGGNVAVGIANDESLGDLRRGGQGSFADGTAEIDITDEQGDAQYVVVTVTELPEINPGGQYPYGLQLSEITVD